MRMLCYELMEIRLERLPKARVETWLKSNIDDMTNRLGPGGVSGAHGPILHRGYALAQGPPTGTTKAPAEAGAFAYRCLNDVSEKGVEPSLPVKGTSTSS